MAKHPIAAAPAHGAAGRFRHGKQPQQGRRQRAVVACGKSQTGDAILRHRRRREHDIRPGSEIGHQNGPRHRLRFQDRALQALGLHRRRYNDGGCGIGGRHVGNRRRHADDVHGAGRKHQVPEFAGVMRAAAVLADEDAEEILEAAFLQALRRLHHHMMTLAAHDAADDQDHLGVALDTPGIAHRLNAATRDFGRIETLKIDAARHDRNPLPRQAVTVVDQLGELFAGCHDAIAARHHAVVPMLEDVLVAMAFVPARHEWDAAQPCGDIGAPGRRAAERMDHVAFAIAHEGVEFQGAAQHHNRVVAGDIERNELAAGRGHVGDQPAGMRNHNGAVAGGEFIPLDVASNNPIVMLRGALELNALVRDHKCDVIHALGRSAAWSAYIAARLRGIPFMTSWYKGHRDQNIFKHWYNSVMARSDRVVATSEQLAQLINDRYGLPWERISVVPCSIDLERFDPAEVARGRIEAMRDAWGIKRDTKVILIVGRIVRRKGHHVMVKTAQRLKERGLKDFLCVFVGEDRGRTHYTGELWDLVLSTGTMDVIRMAAPVSDMPAAYAAASVVVSAAVQPEGLQRAILEAQAMARPVLVSDLGAGPDVVLTPPAVPENRITGLRFHSGDDAALAAALLRLFSLSEPARRAMGTRGRDWVLGHFNAETVAEQTLRLYDGITGRDKAPNALARLRQN